MKLDDVFKLRSDKPDALYFAVDLADADLDEFGQAMLEEQERRRAVRAGRPIPCPMPDVDLKFFKQRDDSLQAITQALAIPAHLIAPLPKPAPPATEDTDGDRVVYCRKYCEKCGPITSVMMVGGLCCLGENETCYRCGASATKRACDPDGSKVLALGKRKLPLDQHKAYYVDDGSAYELPAGMVNYKGLGDATDISEWFQ